MAHQPSLRRRDRANHLDEDYSYYDDARRPSPRGREESLPRRDRDRPSRRPPSPDYGRDDRYDSVPHRSRSHRDPPAYGGAAASPPRRHRNLSPPPAYGAEPPIRSRGGPPSRHTMPVDPYADAYAQDPRQRAAPRGYYEEPDMRGGRRSRHVSPSPERRPRGRDRPPPVYNDDSPPRRHRSSAGAYGRAVSPPVRGYGRAHSPPRSRPPPATAGRPPPAAAGRPRGGGRAPPPVRRNSMPASTKAAAAVAKGWWQNPLVQAAGKTAFTAGAQAVMSSRKEKGPWMGPKGAKIAQAALMGGIVDGFMGRGGGGGGGGDRDRDRGSSGGSSGMKAELMRQGMEAAMGRFGKR